MSIAQGRVFVFNSGRKGQINICPRVSLLEDMDVLRIMVADGSVVREIYISLILLNVTSINL
jgi:hypothetical protein